MTKVIFWAIAIVTLLAFGYATVKAQHEDRPYRVLYFNSDGTDYKVTKVVDPDNGVVCYLGQKEGYGIYSLSCVR